MSESAPPRFAKAHRRSRAEAGGEKSLPLRLHVGAVEVEVPCRFDAGTLRRLLEVLRAAGGVG